MSVKIGVIISTTRPTRVGHTVADWLLKQLPKTEDVGYELIDLKEIDLPFLNEPHSPMLGKYEHQKTKDWSKKVASLDGFIFVTAEYNNGPPAPLKNALDMLYHEWDKKPVAFVGYGTYGATRAVEQLVDNTAKVGMVPLPKTFVGILSPWESVMPEGGVKAEFVHGDLAGLAENLVWWAELLKPARQK